MGLYENPTHRSYITVFVFCQLRANMKISLFILSIENNNNISFYKTVYE